MNTKPLHFAAFVRVSTEKQERQGESLAVQRASIERDVAALGGTIVEWYGGQEHATAGWERKEMDRLLLDASRSRPAFDCVMVAYQDRWSRDNAKSREGLEVFKTQKIGFFIGQHEQDLFSPEHLFMLGISAEVAGFHAAQQAKKSMESRIARARRGIPSGGKKPWGRTWSEADGWGLDPEKHAQIKDIAARYLAGESLKIMAEELGINHTNLHKTLMKRSGPDWECHFRLKKFNIDETVTIKIPELLPASTRRALKQRAKLNRTFARGKAKNKYLLSNFVFCGICGYSMSGQSNHKKHRHYRHHSERRCDGKGEVGWVPAEMIESKVIGTLFEFFGNPAAVEAAIKDALPDMERAQELTRQREALEKQLQKVIKGRERLVDLIAGGELEEAECLERLAASKARISDLESRIVDLGGMLENQPTAQQIKEAAKDSKRAFLKLKVKLNAIRNVACEDFDAMTWDESRALVEKVFQGQGPDGRKLGVYVWPQNRKRGNKSFRYEIVGNVINALGSYPLPSNEGREKVLTRGTVVKSPRYSPAPTPPGPHSRRWRPARRT